MNAFCMLCGSDAFRFTKMAAESAIKHLKFDHAFLAYPSRRMNQDWPSKIRALFPDHIKVHTVPGADRWEDVAQARFGLFDLALKEGVDGWIFSVDDDDVILGTPDLPEDSQVGLLHSDIIAVCQQPTGNMQTGEVFPREASLIRERIEANMFRGSFYGYRAAAWKDVSGDLDRSYTDYEEWRVVWHMIRKGWKDHYIPRVLQVQRCKDFVSAAATQKAKGRSWAVTCSELDAKFPAKSDRYWQNWDHDDKRGEVEEFWRDDPHQLARRKHFYATFREHVLPRTRGMKLMDFGCGVCWDKPEFESMGYRYAGADVTQEMLDRAQAKFPEEKNLHLDDMLNSKFKDRQWPVVNCSAVLPHLPKDVHQTALDTLWRITDKCLVVRLFGVDLHPEDNTSIIKGFLYNRFTESTWRGYFDRLSPSPSSYVVCRGQTKETCDIMIAVVWR